MTQQIEDREDNGVGELYALCLGGDHAVKLTGPYRHDECRDQDARKKPKTHPAKNGGHDDNERVSVSRPQAPRRPTETRHNCRLRDRPRPKDKKQWQKTGAKTRKETRKTPAMPKTLRTRSAIGGTALKGMGKRTRPSRIASITMNPIRMTSRILLLLGRSSSI